jgi:proteasome activator subunit 4
LTQLFQFVCWLYLSIVSQLCTTSFLVEISQYIKIGDLTSDEAESDHPDSEPTLPVGHSTPSPSFSVDELEDPYGDMATRLTDEEEDALLKVGQNMTYHLMQSNLIDC